MKIFALLGLSALFLFSPVLGQPSSSRVTWYTFDAGFGTPASATASIRSAVGQPFIGSMTAGNTWVLAGFLVDTLFRGRVTSVGGQLGVPVVYALLQNYPNPFNPSTTIRYDLPEKSTVELTVYSVLGQEVTRLVHEEQPPGAYAVRFDAARLSSGVYFYTLRAGTFVQTKSLVVLK